MVIYMDLRSYLQMTIISAKYCKEDRDLLEIKKINAIIKIF